MGTIATTDSELVEATRRGEIAAFGHLVARYQDVVSAVSFSSTGDRALGEDVAQETFVAAWRQIDRARAATLRQWLCGIARNLGRKARRRTLREEPTERDDLEIAGGATPFDDLARADSERLVRDALARVPDAYREVLVLYYREDRSIRDVAAALGVGEAAVMQRLSRGRRYLADGVTALVERSLRDAPRARRDLVACVLAAIAALAIPSRVDASPHPAKGSTMMKLALAATAVAAAGTTLYFATRHDDSSGAAEAAAAPPKPAPRALHYGRGVSHPPSLAQAAAPRVVAARAQTADDLPYLPANADLAVGLDLVQLRQSALWQTFVAPALAGNSEIAAIAAECGFDPVAAAQTVSIGLHGFGNDGEPTGTVVIHGYDKAKSLACASGQSRDGLVVTVDDGVVLVSGDHVHLGATFVDDTTAVVVLGATTRADVTSVAAGGGGLAATTGFSPLFANVDPTDPVWLVVTDGSPLIAQVNASLATYTAIRVHGAFGSFGVSDTLSVHAGIHEATGGDAATIVDDAQKALDAMAAQPGGTTRYFDAIDITADGSDVLVDAAISPIQLMAEVSSGAVNVETN